MVRTSDASECRKRGIQPIDCTPTVRLALTAEMITHQLGHNLGMENDFYRQNGKFVHRKYENEPKECGGWMDYHTTETNGWSKCSARDFSRYLTANGKKDPCVQPEYPAPKYLTDVEMKFANLVIFSSLIY